MAFDSADYREPTDCVVVKPTSFQIDVQDHDDNGDMSPVNFAGFHDYQIKGMITANTFAKSFLTFWSPPPSATPAEIKQALVGARALIAQGWTRGKFRRPKTFGVGYNYCAVGAVNAQPKGAWEATRELHKYTNGRDVTRFNDRSTQQDVLELFDKAIAGMMVEA